MGDRDDRGRKRPWRPIWAAILRSVPTASDLGGLFVLAPAPVLMSERSGVWAPEDLEKLWSDIGAFLAARTIGDG